MRRIFYLLALLSLAFPLLASAQTTTYTGTVKDLAQNTVTSGRVTFSLNAPSGGNIPGTGAFVSTTVSCTINASGSPKSSADGTSPCVITNNTALTPTGTSYTLCIQPNYVTPGSCYTTFATGGTVDISTLVPTPATQPSYGIPSMNLPNTWNGTQTFTAPINGTSANFAGNVGSKGILFTGSWVQPIQPSPGAPADYPLGNDLNLAASGSADLHLINTPAVATSSTAVSAGTATIAINSTAGLCTPHGSCGISINYGLSDYEYIQPANWSIVDGNHITATFAQSHSANFTVSQVGYVYLDTDYVSVNSPRSQPTTFTDNQGGAIFSVPYLRTATWPTGAFTFNGHITGNDYVWPGSLYIRNYSTSGYLLVYDFAGAVQRMVLDDPGNVVFNAPKSLTPWTSQGPYVGGMTLGTTSVPSSFWMYTPSLSTAYPSGFGIDGSFASNLATIKLHARSVYSPGPYGAVMAFCTTNQQTETCNTQIDQNQNLALGGHLNQSATKNTAGTCTMTTTSCTFTLNAAFTSTPICIATVQGATAIAGACSVSGTTVTITAASTNTATWAAMLIGNPN